MKLQNEHSCTTASAMHELLIDQADTERAKSQALVERFHLVLSVSDNHTDVYSKIKNATVILSIWELSVLGVCPKLLTTILSSISLYHWWQCNCGILLGVQCAVWVTALNSVSMNTLAVLTLMKTVGGYQSTPHDMKYDVFQKKLIPESFTFCRKIHLCTLFLCLCH